MNKDLMNKKKLLKERIKYFLNKKNQVYICEINMNHEPIIRFGVSDVRQPYKKEKEISEKISIRSLETGGYSYITHTRGECCVKMLSMEVIVILYRPKMWETYSRDIMLGALFKVTQEIIGEYDCITEESYEDGKVSLEERNEGIRKSNLAKREVEQLINKYASTGI